MSNSRALTRLDESSFRPRANPKGSRPRTKQRPAHAGAVDGMVVAVDRGRCTVALDGERRANRATSGPNESAACESGAVGPQQPGTQLGIVCMKARELGRQGIVVGDRVAVVGDISGRPDSLARIVRIAPRRTELRRSADDTPDETTEKVIVANAGQIVITASLADPPPRLGLIDRCLVAAFDAGVATVLCLTKSDLVNGGNLAGRAGFAESLSGAAGHETDEPDGAGNDEEPDDDATTQIDLSADGLSRLYEPLDVRVIVIGQNAAGQFAQADVEAVRTLLRGQVSVMVGHSGVGKSTLINALVPGTDRLTGQVNQVTGRGRHTSTSAVALPLPGMAGWIIDTPGVRSFGLGHVEPEDVLNAFTDVAEAATKCPRGCSHAASEPACTLNAWAAADPAGLRRRRLASLRHLLGEQ